MYMCVNVCSYIQKRTSDLLKLRVTDGDELPDIDAGI